MGCRASLAIKGSYLVLARILLEQYYMKHCTVLRSQQTVHKQVNHGTRLGHSCSDKRQHHHGAWLRDFEIRVQCTLTLSRCIWCMFHRSGRGGVGGRASFMRITTLLWCHHRTQKRPCQLPLPAP